MIETALAVLLMVVFGIPIVTVTLIVVGTAVSFALMGVWECFWKPILHGRLPWKDPLL